MGQRQIAIDLNAYFKRIGYFGDRSVNLETLATIQRLHTQSIPFENLDSLCRKPILLDLDSLQQKLILSGRGGYCFEQNLILRSVLLALGFQVSGLAARVLWNFPEHTLNPRTHMVLRVEINSTSYITDVGFGGLTPTGPLILHSEIEQRTPHETFRLLFDQGSYTLQVNLDQVWKSMYRFDLYEYLLPDYEVSNWYVSTHPNSLFTNSLIAAIATPNYRYCLRNNQLAVYAFGKKEKLQTLSSVSDLRKALSDVFQIRLDSFSNLDETLATLL